MQNADTDKYIHAFVNQTYIVQKNPDRINLITQLFVSGGHRASALWSH